MAIIRLSEYQGELVAPASNGQYLVKPFPTSINLGRLGQIPYPLRCGADSNLFEYLNAHLEPVKDSLDDAPVVVLVHGYQFDPKGEPLAAIEDNSNPHRLIYHFIDNQDPKDEAANHTTSWPLRLGIRKANTTGGSGLAIAFGWYSCGDKGLNRKSYRKAQEFARNAAWVLFNTLNLLHPAGLPQDRPIHLFCHSLGSRVVVQALLHAAGANPALLSRIGKVILLGGAEYSYAAWDLVKALLALRKYDRIPPPAFYNFAAKSDVVLDFAGENFGHRSAPVIGHDGLTRNGEATPDFWIDLQLDRQALQDWFAARNHAIKGHAAGFTMAGFLNHWHYFTHRGNMDVFRAILRDRDGAWEIPRLREQHIVEGVVEDALDNPWDDEDEGE